MVLPSSRRSGNQLDSYMNDGYGLQKQPLIEEATFHQD